MTANLPDSPIARVADDQFGRGRLANSVADIIHYAPAGSSLRIGIYGEWGEGKTSVLKLVDESLSQRDHICVWVAAWVGKSTDDIWDQLLTGVAEQVEVNTRKYKEARSAAQQVQTVRNAASSHWAGKMLDGVLGDKVKASMAKLAQAQRDNLVAAIDENLEGRKIVVFVDDLDRTDQALVPKLLMSLRELFDFPDFYYVLALSPKVIAAGLAEVGFGGEEPHRFLEKIVELPIHLPPVSEKAISRYIRSGIDLIRSVVNIDALQDIVSLLPKNPRRIKLYFRYLASLHGELSRYRADEISWRTLYLAQMLRLEFPEHSPRLAVDDAVMSDLQFGVSSDRSKRLAGIDEATNRLEEQYAPHESEDKKRFLTLCAAIREEGSVLSSRYGLRDMLEIVERPTVFTLQEIDAFYDRFNTASTDTERIETIEQLIGINKTKHPDADLAGAVFEASLLIRNSQLDQAVEAETEAELIQHVANAGPATRMLELQIDEMKLFAERVLDVDSWIKLYYHCLKWARFDRQSDYRKARDDERALLRTSADRLPSDMQLSVLEKRPFDTHHRVGGESAKFIALSDQLKNELTERAIEHAISLFERPDGLEQFWAIDWSTRGKWLLFDHASPFQTRPTRRRLFGLARKARSNQVIHKNFLTYLRMLTHGAFEGGSFSVSECRQLLQDGTLVKQLWKAAVARPLNPRTAGTLRQHRRLLLQMGRTESELPLPRWWKRLEKSFFEASMRENQADGVNDTG